MRRIERRNTIANSKKFIWEKFKMTKSMCWPDVKLKCNVFWRFESASEKKCFNFPKTQCCQSRKIAQFWELVTFFRFFDELVKKTLQFGCNVWSTLTVVGLNNGSECWSECWPKGTQTPTCCVVYVVDCLQTKLFDLVLVWNALRNILLAWKLVPLPVFMMLLSFCKAWPLHYHQIKNSII